MRARKVWRIAAVGAAVAALTALSIWTDLKVNAAENRKAEWQDYIEEVCGVYGICPEFVEAVIEAESSWDPDAVNGSCIGLMQVSESWHRDRMERLGVEDLTDPYDNILVGTDYLAELFGQNEDAGWVLMTYNGDSRADDYLETGIMSQYAEGILERSAELERERGK